jgi:hypothetical protein
MVCERERDLSYGRYTDKETDNHRNDPRKPAAINLLNYMLKDCFLRAKG